MYCVIRRLVIFFQFPSTCLVLSPGTTTDHATKALCTSSGGESHVQEPFYKARELCYIRSTFLCRSKTWDHRLLVSWMVPETKAFVRMQRTQQHQQPDHYLPEVDVIVPRHNQEWFWPENFLSSQDVDGKQNSSAKGKW